MVDIRATGNCWSVTGRRPTGPREPESYFVTRDYADLQVLSQLAWFDEYFLTDPEVAALIRKGEDFGRDDQLTIIAKQREILAKVVPAYAEAAKTGSVELSTTPYYHPILPLVCDTNAGAESTPGLPLPARRFRRPDDANHQIQRAIESHRETFGARPLGLWPSEGSVSEEVLALAHKQGIEWMATDEGVLGRTINYNFARDGDGRLHGDSAEQLYNIHRYEKGDTRMNMVFRDHTLSDLIGFRVLGNAGAGCREPPDSQHPGVGAAGAGARPGCCRVHHSRWRKCLGVLPGIGSRVSAALLRRRAARSR